MARAPLRAGDPARIGHYRLTARLGSGGMGVVYLGIGWDGSQVAVKVLRPELADDQEFRLRFRREVSALMRVKGLCTVRVIEADTESAQPFMITEYAEGPSLAEYIGSHGLIGPGMLYGLATGLAEALTVIHAAGIVHRDFKPSNVILTDAGPKVIDFGIAQAMDATPMTRTGMMVGSAGFMAPEQISGRPGPPADIFVWGVTVAYAATGQPPFGTGDTHAVLYRVMHGDPDISGVPDPLRSLVAAALTKDPDQRPTARKLLDQLTGISVAPSPRVRDSPTQTILAKTWQQTGPGPSGPRPAGEAPRSNGSLLLEPAPSPGDPVHSPRSSRRQPGPVQQADRRDRHGGPGRRGCRGRRGLRHPARAHAEGGAGRQRGRPGNGDPGRAEHPADLSRAAGPRRLPADRPHRRLGEHDGDDGLAEDRQRRPPAVLRVDRRREDLAAGPGSAAWRRPAPAGARGRQDRRRPARLGGIRRQRHLDQPGRAVLDAGQNPRNHPAAVQ